MLSYDVSAVEIVCLTAEMVTCQSRIKSTEITCCGDLLTKRGYSLVVRMVRIAVESIAAIEHGNQRSIERPLQMEDVAPDVKTYDTGDHRRQSPQTRTMMFAGGLVRFGFVPPADDVNQHRV